MISELRHRMIWLFLIFTMLLYTILLLLLMGDAVLKKQHSELEYIGNIANSIVEQFQRGIPLTGQDYSVYARKFQAWVRWSDNVSQQSGPECFSTPSSVLISQMDSASTIIEMEEREEIVSNTVPNRKISRTTYDLKGSDANKYYGIQVIFSDQNTNEQRLIVIRPQSSAWSIIRQDCCWYPLIWLVMLAAMYGMSRFLIQKAIIPVEASMKSQKDFIAAASHELKAPLAVIQANAESLEQSENDFLKQTVILEECNRMSHLIQSLLSLASSDAGNWKMNIQDTDMDTLFIEAWETWQSPCRKKGISFHINLKEESYPKVPCDKERISQVLGILLDNAISYSPPGASVEVEAMDHGRQFDFSVIDHGPGIPDAKKARVFDRFYRGDPSRSAKNHCGLGLSIAKEIITLHGGNIEITDTPGGGCTFRVSLPMEHKNFRP